MAVYFTAHINLVARVVNSPKSQYFHDVPNAPDKLQLQIQPM